MRKLAKFRKDQAGYALVWVLVLLIVSGLVLIPLLLLMTTGLTSSDIREESTQRFYAADAGIEAGIQQIWNGSTVVPNFALNGSTVVVTIIEDPVEDNAYKITSTATDNQSNKTTTIESYMSYDEYDLFANAITSRGNIELKPDATVTGDVQYSGTLTEQPGSTINGDRIPDDSDWPTVQELKDRYGPQVAGHDYDSDTIDIKDLAPLREIGPLYRDGDLNIYSSENQEVLQAELTGTIYVTGDLTIGQTNHDFILDLGAHTIFCEGNIVVVDKCIIEGDGCFVIALGDVDFGPKMQTEEDNFVFVMSVTGTVDFHPQGNFYGSVAGDVNIEIFPGFEFVHTEPPGGGLNFPNVLARAVTAMATYNIVD